MKLLFTKSWLASLIPKSPYLLIILSFGLIWLIERLDLERSTKLILIFSFLMVGEITAGIYTHANVGGHWLPFAAITAILLIGTFSALRNELSASRIKSPTTGKHPEKTESFFPTTESLNGKHQPHDL